MSRADGRKEHRRVSLLTAVGVCGTAAALTWASSSIGLYDGPDRLVGPFEVPLPIEWSGGAVTVGMAILGPLSARRARRRSAAWTLCLAAVGWLLVASIAAAAGWRVVTAGGDGANIGGGLVLLFGPVILAVLLQCAIGTEAESRGPSARVAVLLSVCLWLATAGVSASIWSAGG